MEVDCLFQRRGAGDKKDPPVMAKEAQSKAQRQRAWLKRSNGESGSWRPSKRYRTAAERWMAQVDNMCMFSGPPLGCKFFMKDLLTIIIFTTIIMTIHTIIHFVFTITLMIRIHTRS